MNHRRRIGLAFSTAMVVLASATVIAAPTHAVAPPTPTSVMIGGLDAEHVDDELVVGFDAWSSSGQIDAALQKADAAGAEDLAVPHTKLVKLERGESLEAAMETLRRQPGVRFVEPNYIHRPDAVPDDPRFPEQWALQNTGQYDNGVVDADIDAPEAWDLTTGSTAITVAVIDTGIDYNHPDLAGNLWTNPGESGAGKENNHIDDDQNGFVDDWHGWDFVNNDNDPRDHDMWVGHGTHVAGTIGGRGDNGTAVTGINWRVGLVGVRVFDASGAATSAAVAEAFDYAGDLGVKVVNYSGGSSAFSSALQAAINAHPNTLYVTTAGNSAKDLDVQGNDHYPCEYPSANVICVASSNSKDQLSAFSNRGSNVDLAAPGEGIMSLAPAKAFLYNEQFTGDPFASRWTRDTTGANNWKSETQYSPYSVGSAPSLTDGSPFAADYPVSSDTWVQTSAAIDLSGRIGCSLSFASYVDVMQGDAFRLWAGPNSALTNTDLVFSVFGTGFFSPTVDLNALSGGPLDVRFGLFSDATPQPGYDGVYIDNLEVRCVSNDYVLGGDLDIDTLNGTSFAAPQVTGAAALALARNPALTTAQLRAVLLSSGDVKPAFQGNVTNTGRRLNLFGAVETATSPPLPKFGSLTPTRILDTRLSTPLAPGATMHLVVTGQQGVPAQDVDAVMVNITVTGATADGYLTTWPKGETKPNASSLNFAAGQTVANLAVAKVGADGSISIFNAGDTIDRRPVHVIVDVVGYFPTSAMGAVSPDRLLDTRFTNAVGPGQTIQLPVLGRGGVPTTGVGAVIVNLTATGATADGFLTTWPNGEAKPNASSLNFAAGQTVANLIVAKVGTDGSISIFNAGDTIDRRPVHVIADVVGWFAA